MVSPHSSIGLSLNAIVKFIGSNNLSRFIDSLSTPGQTRKESETEKKQTAEAAVAIIHDIKPQFLVNKRHKSGGGARVRCG